MTFVYILTAVVGGFVALMLIMRVMIAMKSSAMKGKAAPELPGKPGKHVGKGKPALFYFYSPSCGACASMTPAVKNLAKEEPGVFAVDISKDMDTARKFSVMATPTLVVVRDKLVENILIGPQNPNTLGDFLQA